MDGKTMKIWVVDSINDGICGAFDSEEKAKEYLLNTICDSYDRVLKSGELREETAMNYLKNIMIDINTAIHELYVEDVAYIYDIEVK